jgi:hypothetical protein
LYAFNWRKTFFDTRALSPAVATVGAIDKFLRRPLFEVQIRAGAENQCKNLASRVDLWLKLHFWRSEQHISAEA